MLEFTFNNLFKTSNKGIPSSTQLSTPFSLSKIYFIYSVIIQAIFLLIFVFYFIISIYRVLKMIKNHKFKDIKVTSTPNSNNYKKNTGQSKLQDKSQKPNSVYLFDQEDDDEKDSDKEKRNKQKQKEEKMRFDNYHDKNQRKFLIMDNKFLSLQCLLIPFVVCNNLLNTDIFYPVFLLLTITSFLLFNIKKICKNKVLKSLHLCFATLGFFSLFYGNRLIKL